MFLDGYELHSQNQNRELRAAAGGSTQLRIAAIAGGEKMFPASDQLLPTK